jgi:hypothetical protein
VTRLTDAALAYFAAEEWPIVEVRAGVIYQTAFDGPNGSWNCYLHVHADRNQVVFYTLYPEHVPASARPAVCEFITRANFGIPIGNFELDHTDGALRFKTSIDVGTGELSETLTRQIVHANVFSMNKYAPGISAVLQGASPESAVAAVEQA